MISPCRQCGSRGFILNLVGLLRKSKFVDNKFSVECPGWWNRIWGLQPTLCHQYLFTPLLPSSLALSADLFLIIFAPVCSSDWWGSSPTQSYHIPLYLTLSQLGIHYWGTKLARKLRAEAKYLTRFVTNISIVKFLYMVHMPIALLNI